MVLYLGLFLYVVLKFCTASQDESLSPLSYINGEFPSGHSPPAQSAEHMLTMMKVDFGQYLENLPVLYQTFDGPMSQAARRALYWNKVDDLHVYDMETPKSQLLPASPHTLPILYSHYAVHFSYASCSKMDIMKWIKIGGTASGLVNVLTPLPLGIFYKNTTSKASYVLSRKLLRHYERKLSIFAKCYSIFIGNTDFTNVPKSFFSFSELDAPLLSGIKFSTLIQLSRLSPSVVSSFLLTTNDFVQAWVPRDFWRSIKDSHKPSDFSIVNAWVQKHYFDLETSFFATGFRKDTLIQARRTCFLLHRAMSSFVWEIDRLPRFPSSYTTNFINLIEKLVVEEIFLKFQTLPSIEEIEISPELAFKVLGLIQGAGKHFGDYLVKGPVFANLKRPDLPPLEPVLARISIEKLVEISGWPYLLESLGVSAEKFSWKSLPENWFASLNQGQLYPFYDGGSWFPIRYLKTIINPSWKDIQRCHFFTFITPFIMGLLNPIQQLQLILHPNSPKYLSPQVLSSLDEDRFCLIYEHAAAQGLLPAFKKIMQRYYGSKILQLEDELVVLKQQLKGNDVVDKPLQQKISNLE